jgi:death on curing protein
VKEPRWVKRTWVDALHLEELRHFGGQNGVRDQGAIESAIARPQNKWAYDGVSELPLLAASLGYGLVRNHGYVDGNKRVGFVAMGVFLELNGYALQTDEADVVRTMLAVAAGTMSEEELGAWVTARAKLK